MRFDLPGKALGVLLGVALVAGAAIAQERTSGGRLFTKVLPNNFPQIDTAGFSATVSTRGFVDLTSEYFQAQGTNSRSCVTCHLPQDAWSITADVNTAPDTAQAADPG